MTDLVTALPVLLGLFLGVVSSSGESRRPPFIVTARNSSSLDCLLENIFSIRKHQKIYSEGLRFTGFNRRVLFPKYRKLNSRDGKFIQKPFKSRPYGTGPVSLLNKLSQFRHRRTSDRTTVDTETGISDLSLTAVARSINRTATSVISGQFLTYLLTSSLKNTIGLSPAAAVSSSVGIGDEQSGFTSHHRVIHFKQSAFNTSIMGDQIMLRNAKSDVHHRNFINMSMNIKPCCSSFRHFVSNERESWLFPSSRNILRFSRKLGTIYFQSKTKNPKPGNKLIIQSRQMSLRPAELKVRLTPPSNLANVIINITDLSLSQYSKQRHNSVLKSALFNNTSDYICKSYVDISLSPTDCSMHHFIRSYFRLKERISSDLKQDLLLEKEALILSSAKRTDGVDMNFYENQKDDSEFPTEQSISTHDRVTPKIKRSNQHTRTSRRTVKRSELRPFTRKSTMQESSPNGILPASSYRNTYDSSFPSLSSTNSVLPLVSYTDTLFPMFVVLM